MCNKNKIKYILLCNFFCLLIHFIYIINIVYLGCYLIGLVNIVLTLICLIIFFIHIKDCVLKKYISIMDILIIVINVISISWIFFSVTAWYFFLPN